MQAPTSFRFEIQDRVGVITFTRPDTLNSLTFDVYRELKDLFFQLETDKRVASVVITGEGRGFCSGGDVHSIIGELFSRDMPGLVEFTRLTCDLIKNIRALRKPVIAALNGTAAGAGAVIALAADLRVASEKAKIAFLFVKVGLAGADMGAAYLLPKVVGLSKATELLYFGDPIDAPTAERYGLFNKVVPPEKVREESLAWARRLAEGPSFALGMTKELLNGELNQDLYGALDNEARAQAVCMQTKDFREAYEAFTQKRPARFTGELTMHTSLLTQEHLALAEDAQRDFAALEPTLPPEPDAELVRRLAGLNYYRFLVPAAYGGELPTVDVRSICVLREEMAYRNAAADSVFAVQGLGSHPVLLGGNEQQRKQFLPQVADGHALFAFALTEPEAGSDVAALETTARKDGEYYVLDGHKRFISNAGVATHYTVFARTGDGAKGLSAFVVPADAPGFRVVRPMDMMGEHPIGELAFEQCRIPVASRLGEEGQGMKLALSTLDIFRSTVGAAAVGMARRALDEALSYSKRRRQFGAPLADLAPVQAMLADSAVELEASCLLVHKAAATKDSGAERVTYEAAVAKLFATEAAQRIIDRCLQVHGGNGVVKGFAVERLYRDIRALRIYEGASEVQRLVIARHLLRRG